MARGERPDWAHDLGVLYRVETALGPEERTALHAALRLAGIDADVWLAIPALAQVYGLLAALNLAQDFETAGVPAGKALARAGGRLGIPAATLTTWLRRWKSYADAA